MQRYDIDLKVDNENSVTFLFDGEFSIYSVAEIKKKFDEALCIYKNFTLVLTKVSKIDTAGFQLITYMKREIANAKKEYRVVKPSKDVKKFFDFFHESI